MLPFTEGFTVGLRRQHLASPGQHILVACSGGLDSLVLLHVLRFGCPVPFRMSVAHFDHRMRTESGADARWLRGLCRAWEVAYYHAQAEKS